MDFVLAGRLIVRHSSCFQLWALVTQGSCQSTHLRFALLCFFPDGLFGRTWKTCPVQALYLCRCTRNASISFVPIPPYEAVLKCRWPPQSPPCAPHLEVNSSASPLLLVLQPHKVPQTGQLITHGNSSLALLEAGSLRPGCQRGQVRVRVCFLVSSQVGKRASSPESFL